MAPERAQPEAQALQLRPELPPPPPPAERSWALVASPLVSCAVSLLRVVHVPPSWPPPPGQATAPVPTPAPAGTLRRPGRTRERGPEEGRWGGPARPPPPSPRPRGARVETSRGRVGHGPFPPPTVHFRSVLWPVGSRGVSLGRSTSLPLPPAAAPGAATSKNLSAPPPVVLWGATSRGGLGGLGSRGRREGKGLHSPRPGARDAAPATAATAPALLPPPRRPPPPRALAAPRPRRSRAARLAAAAAAARVPVPY